MRPATNVYQLSDEEESDINDALAEASRDEFATDEEVAAVFLRHRLGVRKKG